MNVSLNPKKADLEATIEELDLDSCLMNME